MGLRGDQATADTAGGPELAETKGPGRASLALHAPSALRRARHARHARHARGLRVPPGHSGHSGHSGSAASQESARAARRGTRIPAAEPARVPATPAEPPDTPPAAPAAEPAEVSCVDDGEPYDAPRYATASAPSPRPSSTAARPAAPAMSPRARALAERFRCLGLVAGRRRRRATSSRSPPTATPRRTSSDTSRATTRRSAATSSWSARTTITSAMATSAPTTTPRAWSRCSRSPRRSASTATPQRTIAFVVFGGEELGSTARATSSRTRRPRCRSTRRLRHQPRHGRQLPLRRRRSTRWGRFAGSPAPRSSSALVAEHQQLHVGVGGRGVGSDHEAFCQAGVPYVFFWTPDKRCYHKALRHDRRLDAAHLGEIAAFAGALTERLSGSPGNLAGARAHLGCTGR